MANTTAVEAGAEGLYRLTGNGLPWVSLAEHERDAYRLEALTVLQSIEAAGFVVTEA